MAFKMKVLALALVTMGSVSGVRASQDLDKDYYTIGKMEIREILGDEYGQESYETVHQKSYAQVDGAEASNDPYYGRDNQRFNDNQNRNRGKNFNPPVEDAIDPIEKAGKVISVARDLVALGEDVYRLVIKGKPTNATTYAPISVVPKVNGQPVDPLEVEYSHFPVKRSFQVIYKNLYGIEVVNFRFSILWAYGGSYNGKGAYLSSVQIIPDSVRTLFGYDFTATMKLGGIENLGARTNPIAGATILLEYTVSSVLVANNEVVSFTVTGKGGFQKH